MRKWNTRKVEIIVVKWGDYNRSLRVLKPRTKYSHCRKMYVNLKNRMARGEVAPCEVSSSDIAKLY